ncbi:ABC transporter permease [Paenibacillus nasutitermitis]|uniref:ABC-2 type transport system permease protein n=1 Tax=Paenibacillus nasutitermitis TaxID=1652958 RepID=A0A916ZBX4_9BACL|nr:ABC transporter permease [Paenibacillus nasutitermitis]GGD84506.1 hypothetical protein GCM10010911_48530 [Paenibacillus nasutitermitis]
MSNLILAELYKLRKDRSFRMLIYLVLLIAAAYPIINYIDNQYDGDAAVSGAEFFLSSVDANVYIIKFGLSILAGFFISSEYSTGVMKTIASSGSSRSRIFSAKLIGFTAGSMILSLVFPVVSTLVASLLSSFGELPVDNAAGFLLRTLGLTLLYAAGFAAIAAFFSTIFTDSGKTIGFLLIFFIMIDSILVGLGSFMPFFMDVYDHSVFKLMLDIVKPQLEGRELVNILLTPVLTMIVMGILGVLVYRRKEIK